MKPETETAVEALLLDPEGPSVTAIGGGHGQAAALEAIQCYAGTINAVVAVGDDGGSSGRLSELGFPPPGDIRRCLLALTPEPSLWSELFSHRFKGGDVAEHSLGNLILLGLADLYGDFGSAINTAERMLGCLGSVIPVADEPVQLEAVIDGERVIGQDMITRRSGHLTELDIVPRDTIASLRALDALAQAEQIVIGPGSLYTSVVSALKVNMVAPALMEAEAQKVFVLNLITQDGETLGMDGAAHLAALAQHAGVEGPGVIVAHDGPLDVPDDHHRVTVAQEEAAVFGWRLVTADLVDEYADWPQHDPLKLGQVLERVGAEG